MTKKISQAEHAKNFMAELSRKSEELYEVRMWLNGREEEFKTMTDKMYAKEKQLKGELLEEMNALNLTSLKVKSGDRFSVKKTQGVEVINEPELIAWAIKHHIAKPDPILLKQALKTMAEKNQELPPCVKLYERDTISIVRKEAKKE